MVALPGRSATALLRQVRDAIRACQALGGSWRNVIEAVRNPGRDIWRALTPDARRRAVRRLRPFWDAHRFRAAPQIEAILDARLKNNLLTVQRARLGTIVSSPSDHSLGTRETLGNSRIRPNLHRHQTEPSRHSPPPTVPRGTGAGGLRRARRHRAWAINSREGRAVGADPSLHHRRAIGARRVRRAGRPAAVVRLRPIYRVGSRRRAEPGWFERGRACVSGVAKSTPSYLRNAARRRLRMNSVPA